MPSSRHARPRALFILLVVLTSVLLIPVPASAHTQLQSADPAENAVLDEVPATVSLTFSEDLGQQSQLAVSAADGSSVAAAKAALDGPTISIAIAPDAPPGKWTVGYRVISADGHPVSGEYTFTVDVPTPTPTAAPTSPAATTPAASPADTPAATDAAHPSPGTQNDGDDGGASWWIVAAVVIVLVAAAAGGIALSRRRRS